MMMNSGRRSRECRLLRDNNQLGMRVRCDLVTHARTHLWTRFVVVDPHHPRCCAHLSVGGWSQYNKLLHTLYWWSWWCWADVGALVALLLWPVSCLSIHKLPIRIKSQANPTGYLDVIHILSVYHYRGISPRFASPPLHLILSLPSHPDHQQQVNLSLAIFG